MIHLSPSAADAGRRNMLVLTQLRWIAVVGQLATVGVVHAGLGIPLPLLQLLMSIATLAALNVASHLLLTGGRPIGDGILFGALLFDVAALTVQLNLTGGLANPFVWLFLLQVALGAILLRPRWACAIAAATLAGLALLTIDPVPLILPPAWARRAALLDTIGNVACFTLTAALLVAFVTRVTRNLSARDAALAAARQRAAEEDHIVRIGLLASGAAHELGTPLATLSVVLGDLKRLPPATAIGDLADDVAEAEAALARCKAIVGGILMSAGEARGEAPRVMTAPAFVAAVVEAWQAGRTATRIDVDDRTDPRARIVADPALLQVIGAAIDNAAEVSPDWIGVLAQCAEGGLVLDVLDAGPGFSAEILATFGQPYRSTKGRPGGGLGLFLLVNAVRKLGGRAEAANRAEGGARVRITLPLAGEAA